MDRFPMMKAVETVTVQDLIAALLCFWCADIFSGKRREAAYNQAQTAAVFLQKQVLASNQRWIVIAVCWLTNSRIEKLFFRFCFGHPKRRGVPAKPPSPPLPPSNTSLSRGHVVTSDSPPCWGPWEWQAYFLPISLLLPAFARDTMKSRGERGTKTAENNKNTVIRKWPKWPKIIIIPACAVSPTDDSVRSRRLCAAGAWGPPLTVKLCSHSHLPLTVLRGRTPAPVAPRGCGRMAPVSVPIAGT